MSEERTSKRRRWLLVTLLGLAVWAVYSTWPQDLGRELRHAVYRGDLATAERLLRKHPELVNETNSLPRPPAAPSSPRPSTLNITEEFTMYVWDKLVWQPVKLENHAWFQAVEAERLPPLHIAIDRNNLPLTRLLLEHGAQVEQLSRGDYHVLHRAARRSPELVKLLLEQGARPDPTNFYGQTPLHLAVHNRTSKVLELLLAAGADPNHLSRGGVTPLHNAAFNEQATNACALLLRYGARLDITNRAGKTALEEAQVRGNSNIIRVLTAPAAAQPAPL